MMKPSKTSIKKALSEAAFDPRKPGPMQIIMETGNAEYYIQRAREILAVYLDAPIPDKLDQAMALIALAKVTMVTKVEPKPLLKKKS